MPKIRECIKNFTTEKCAPSFGAIELFKYIGPGLLVTVGFIDPGNWAANITAGSQFGYKLLWVVTLSTTMLIVLQHNAAHLGIASGLCISEAATKYLRPAVSRSLIGTAVAAAVSTALAEILGAAIALNMLFGLPVKIGAALTVVFVSILVFLNTYKRIETIIIGFVSIIGVSFIYELYVVPVDWTSAVRGWVMPSFPDGSIVLIMSVLGAVVMPHNLFLHSEVIQSRQWNLEDEKTIKRQLKYEFFDTLVSMGTGWAINSAMIIVAAATFFAANINVTELAQAKEMLVPVAGKAAALVFAFALLCSGIASSVTAAVAGGSIFAGLFGEPFDIRDKHSRLGVAVVFIGALAVILAIENTLMGLVVSQVILSIQLPFTIFLLIGLTSSKKVMGSHANNAFTKTMLYAIGGIVAALNIYLFTDVIRGLLSGN